MANTQWYLEKDILQGAEDLQKSYSSGVCGWLDYAFKSGLLLFRDPQGSYWFLDALQKIWYRFDEQNWRRMPGAPERLEGLAEAADSLGILPGDLATDADPFGEDESMPPQKAFETMVKDRRRAYLQGETSSAEIEQVLGRLNLLDNQGGFWTVGFSSSRWYCFRNGGWDVSNSPPRSQQLVIWQADNALDQLSEQASAQVISFLLYGAGTLPEPVSTPWIPPHSLPDLAKPFRTCDLCAAESPYGSRYCNQCGARFGCPQCGAENPPGSRFCNQCGATLQSSGGS